jgi:hypothetical protein
MVIETRGYGVAATRVTRACGPTVRATVYPAGPSYAPRRHVPSAGNTSQYGGSWQLNLERKYLIVEEAVSLKTRHDWELYTHLAARFGPVLATHEETCCRWFSSRSGRGSWITSGFRCGFFRAA